MQEHNARGSYGDITGIPVYNLIVAIYTQARRDAKNGMVDAILFLEESGHIVDRFTPDRNVAKSKFLKEFTQ